MPEISLMEEKASSESDIDDLTDGSINETSKSEDTGEDETGTDDDEVESEMLRKLEKDAYADILLGYHPEIKQNNYNDILAMCKIVRDAKGIITDGLHKTIPWLTKYERARVLGLRTKQLNNGADAFIEIPPGMINGDKIALEELNQKKVPFIIRRPIPNGGTEYWRLEDLELLNSY
jgi:DNA-directed RNA polymerase I, II, and III subunit RPABC2